MENKNLARFLLTFFLGWIGSLIINHSSLKAEGWTSRTGCYILLTIVTFGIYQLVASICNLTSTPPSPRTSATRRTRLRPDFPVNLSGGLPRIARGSPLLSAGFRQPYTPPPEKTQKLSAAAGFCLTQHRAAHTVLQSTAQEVEYAQRRAETDDRDPDA